MENLSYLYILTNQFNSALHIGVTNNLLKRVYDYKKKKTSNPLSIYHFSKLVYYEKFTSLEQAYSREKDLKNQSRDKKISIIERFNPEWEDLYTKIA